MSEEERKEATEEKSNYVRMARVLLEVGQPLMRAQFKQAHNDATGSEWVPVKGPLFWQQTLDPGTKKRLKGDAGSKVQAGDVEAWDCTILLEMLINGVFKHRGQPWQVQCFLKIMGGSCAFNVTKPIRDFRNSLNHAAGMRVTEAVMQRDVARLFPTLLKMHSALDAKYRPFADVQAVVKEILEGPLLGQERTEEVLTALKADLKSMSSEVQATVREEAVKLAVGSRKQSKQIHQSLQAAKDSLHQHVAASSDKSRQQTKQIENVVHKSAKATEDAVLQHMDSRLDRLEQQLQQKKEEKDDSSLEAEGQDSVWESKWKVSRLFPDKSASVGRIVQRTQQEGAPDPASFVQMPAVLEAAAEELLGSRALLVKGLPGKGKTHVMASLERWLQRGGSGGPSRPAPNAVTASHFCSAADSESLDAWNVLWSLVGQLGDRSRAFRNQLLGDLQLQTDLGLQFKQAQLVAKGSDCKKAFLALGGALSRCHAENEAEQQSQEAKPEEHERVVVLVDGLDEAWERSREVVDRLADLIGDPRLQAAPRVAFVFSSRPLPSLLQALGARLNATSQVLAELDLESKRLLPFFQQAVRLHVTHRLRPLLGEEENEEAYRGDLLEACGGLETPNFLHADLVLVALRKKVIRLSELRLVPRTIAGKVQLFLQRQFPEPQQRTALAPLLELLVAAPAHLPRRTLLTALWLDGQWLEGSGGGLDWNKLEGQLDAQLRQLASFVSSGAPPPKSASPLSSTRRASPGLGTEQVGFHYPVVKESLKDNPFVGDDRLALLDLSRGHRRLAGAWLQLHKRYAGEGKLADRCLAPLLRLSGEAEEAALGGRRGKVPRAGRRRRAGLEEDVSQRQASQLLASVLCGSPDKLADDLEELERDGSLKPQNWLHSALEGLPACDLVCSPELGRVMHCLAAFASDDFRVWEGRQQRQGGDGEEKEEEEEADERFCSADIVGLVESVAGRGSLQPAKLLAAAIPQGDVEVVRWALARQEETAEGKQQEGESSPCGLHATLVASALDTADPALAAAVVAELLPLAGGWQEGSTLVESLRLVAASSQPLDKVQLVLEEYRKRRPPLGTPTMLRGQANSQLLRACQGAKNGRRDGALLEWLSSREKSEQLGTRWVELLRGTMSVEESNEAGNLRRLPKDLLGIVLGFLNGDSWGRWCAMAGVCKTFYRWHLRMLPKQLQIEKCYTAHMNDRRLALMPLPLGHILRSLHLARTDITDAGVAFLSSLTKLQRLDLSRCNKITDAGVASLSSLTGLQTLNLNRCNKITDAGVASLSSLTGLQTLNLSLCDEITDAGVASLSSLTGLQRLDLGHCDKITDAGVASFSSLTGLQTLHLNRCKKITDAGVSSLSSLTGLQTLNLSLCDEITDAGVASLSSLSGLQRLNLSLCDEITDAGVASLSSLTGLQTLNLNRCKKITDAGVSSLSSLTGLQTLNLSLCDEITDAGVASLSSLTGLQRLDLGHCDKITDAGVASFSSLTGLQTLHLNRCKKITDAGVSSLSSLTGLQTLNLSLCDEITDAGVASLSSLIGLQRLDLSLCYYITDAGLSSLSSLTGLQTLHLNYCCHITDEGLSSLSSLTGLQRLDLGDCDKITDAGVASLSSLTGLQTLNLNRCNKITDAGVASLQTLDLSECNEITDAGVASLSSLTGLQTLDLGGCDKITDAGVASLSSLTGLQTLNLTWCNEITDAGVASLSSLTGLQIHHHRLFR